MSKDFIRINQTATTYLIPRVLSWFNNDRKIYLNIEDLSSMLDYAKTIEQMQIEQAYRDGARAGALMGKYVGTSARDYYNQTFKTKSVYEYYLASKGGEQ